MYRFLNSASTSTQLVVPLLFTSVVKEVACRAVQPHEKRWYLHFLGRVSAHEVVVDLVQECLCIVLFPTLELGYLFDGKSHTSAVVPVVFIIVAVVSTTAAGAARRLWVTGEWRGHLVGSQSVPKRVEHRVPTQLLLVRRETVTVAGAAVQTWRSVDRGTCYASSALLVNRAFSSIAAVTQPND